MCWTAKKMYANVENYTTADRSTKKPEAHNKYIDVQYLGKGTEKIYFAPRTADVKVVEDYAKERDLLFFENIEEKRLCCFKRRRLCCAVSVGAAPPRLQC